MRFLLRKSSIQDKRLSQNYSSSQNEFRAKVEAPNNQKINSNFLPYIVVVVVVVVVVVAVVIVAVVVVVSVWRPIFFGPKTFDLFLRNPRHLLDVTGQ